MEEGRFVVVETSGGLDGIHEVLGRLGETLDEGAAAFVSMRTIRLQTAMIAKEDEALANVLTSLFRMLIGRSIRAIVHEDGQVKSIDEYLEDGAMTADFLGGCMTGGTAMLLEVVRAWPGDPLELVEFDDLHDVEDKLAFMFNEAAARLGLVPNL